MDNLLKKTECCNIHLGVSRLQTIHLESSVIHMDTNTYSKILANYIAEKIDASSKSKAEVAREIGVPWTSFCRKIDHPTSYFFTVPEVIAICESLGIGFIETLQKVEALADKEGNER